MSDYNVKTLLYKSKQFLDRKGVNGNTRLDAELLLADILGMDRLKLYLNQDKILNKDEIDLYRKAILRRAKKEPVAYILGYKEFLGLNFNITPDVLIPRPETEELTAHILQNYLLTQKDNIEKKTTKDLHEINKKQDTTVVAAEGDESSEDVGEKFKNKKKRVLDLCCGCGCIGIALKKFRSNWQVFFIDSSMSALMNTKNNYKNIIGKLPESSEEIFYESDLFSKFPKKYHNSIDLIVSNPPYINKKDVGELSQDVVNYEPPIALFVKNPEEFLTKLIKESNEFLSENGEFYMEGDPGILPLISQKSQNLGYNHAELKKDLCGKIRFLYLKKK
jgi:release factor glutamine methyltransferase